MLHAKHKVAQALVPQKLDQTLLQTPAQARRLSLPSANRRRNAGCLLRLHGRHGARLGPLFQRVFHVASATGDAASKNADDGNFPQEARSTCVRHMHATRHLWQGNLQSIKPAPLGSSALESSWRPSAPRGSARSHDAKCARPRCTILAVAERAPTGRACTAPFGAPAGVRAAGVST